MKPHSLKPGNSLSFARTIFDTQASKKKAINGVPGRIFAEKAAKILHNAGIAKVNTVTKDGNVAEHILQSAEQRHD